MVDCIRDTGAAYLIHIMMLVDLGLHLLRQKSTLHTIVDIVRLDSELLKDLSVALHIIATENFGLNSQN